MGGFQSLTGPGSLGAGRRGRWGLGQTCTALSPATARFAEEACALLTSSKFEACHRTVGPQPYVQNCRYDVCSCSDGRDCLCSAVANYAAACARRGVHIGWREPSFCGGCPPSPPVPTQPRRALLGCPANCWSFSRHCLSIIAFRTGPKGIQQAWILRTLHLQPLFFFHLQQDAVVGTGSPTG